MTVQICSFFARQPWRDLVLVMLVGSLWGAIALPATASLCRNYDHHQICIRTIKRSAKYHWQYRASVSIDGVVHPIKRYDCHPTKTLPKGTTLSQQQDRVGALICTLLQR